MEISQGDIPAAVAEEIIDQNQGQAQNQGNVQPGVQYITLANISDIVKDAVGGVKDYIDNALSSTKSQVLESARESAKSASSFKFKGNRIQFEFNVKVKEKIESALTKIEKADTAAASLDLKGALDEIKVRNKHIKLADKNESWKVVDEYKAEELADNAEDEKRIKAAVKAVASKKPIKGSKKGQFRNAPYHFPSGSRRSDAYHQSNMDPNFRGYMQQNRFQFTSSRTGSARRLPKPTDICFRCGNKGHWQTSCSAQYRNFQPDKQTQ